MTSQPLCPPPSPPHRQDPLDPILSTPCARPFALARQESYAGFMETIAAARDLGTWASVPARPSHEQHSNKENVHATATATAVPYGGGGGDGNNPRVPRYRPLVELPNGRGSGRVHGSVYPIPPASSARNPSAAFSPSAAAAAAWRGSQFGSGCEGVKDSIRVAPGDPSSRRAGHYRRSATCSDVVLSACGGGGMFAAEAAAAARRPRSGVGAGAGSAGGGGGARRRGGAGVAGVASVTAADEMHLAAVAMGRARRGRLSTRF